METNYKVKRILIPADDLSNLGGSVISVIRFINYLYKHFEIIIVSTSENFVEKLDINSKVKFVKCSWWPRLPGYKITGKLGYMSRLHARKILIDYKIDFLLGVRVSDLGKNFAIEAKSLGIPSATFCHAQTENATKVLPFKLGKYRFVYNFFAKFIKDYLIEFDKIIVVSEFSKKILLHDYTVFNPNNIIIISNGVDNNKYKKEENFDEKYILKKYDIDKKCTNLVTLGRLSPEKCIDTLIYAMDIICKKNIQDVYLNILSDGPSRIHLEKLVAKLNLTKRVKFLGFIDDSEIAQLLNVCDIFIHSSEIELEGMAIIEAMSCGLPIIVSDSKLSASGQFIDKNGYRFIHNDPLDLANKILKLKQIDLKPYSDRSIDIAKKYSIKFSVNKLANLINGDML